MTRYFSTLLLLGLLLTGNAQVLSLRSTTFLSDGTPHTLEGCTSDAWGNTYLSGWAGGSLQLGLFNTSAGGSSFLAKRDAGENWLWLVEMISGTFGGLALAPDGRLVSLAIVEPGCEINGVPITVPSTQLAVLWFSPQGELLDHTTTPISAGYDMYFWAPECASDGTVVFSGFLYPNGTITVNGNTLSGGFNGLGLAGAVSASGSWLWALGASSSGISIVEHPLVTAGDDIYLQFDYTGNICTIGGFAAHAFSNSPDTANTGICKVDLAGQVQWVAGPEASIPGRISGMFALDAQDQPLFIGRADDQTTLGSWSVNEGAIMTSLSPGGIWSQPLTVNAVNATPGAIGTTPDGDIVVYGTFEGQAQLGSITLSNTQGGDRFIGGMSSTGQWRWAVPIYADYTLSLFRSLDLSSSGQLNALLDLEYEAAIGSTLFDSFSGSGSVLISFGPSCMSAFAGPVHNATCPSDADGSIAISVFGGIPPYSYAWNNGTSDPVATGLAPGVYGLTITDSDTCHFDMLIPVIGPVTGSGTDLQAWAYAEPCFRPGQPTAIITSPFNGGCMSVDGEIRIVLDPLVHYTGNLQSPDTVIGDTVILHFDATAFASYYNERVVNVITDPAAVIGDSVCLDVLVGPTDNDVDLSNNAHTMCFPIVNSFDPNFKEVIPRGLGATGRIAPQQPLTYTVHFQNTGTAPAFDIVVLDTLDTDLDLASVHLVASSHPTTFDILPGRVLRFTFQGIHLPDSTSDEANSHGFLVYNVDPVAGLGDGTEITNTGNIYFDLNAPVITNTTLNTIDVAASVKEQGRPWMRVRPNPTTSTVVVEVPDELRAQTLLVVNASGQVVARYMTHGVSRAVDMSSLPTGLYTIVCGNARAQAVKQ